MDTSYVDEFENASSDEGDHSNPAAVAASSSAVMITPPLEQQQQQQQQAFSSAKGSPTANETKVKAIEDALALGIWKAVKDESSGKTYYYHTISQKTTWDLEKELLGVTTGAAASAPTSSPTLTTLPAASATSSGKPPLPSSRPSLLAGSLGASEGPAGVRVSVDTTTSSADADTAGEELHEHDTDGKPMFKKLTNYVAFGSFAAASSTTDDETTSAVADDPHRSSGGVRTSYDSAAFLAEKGAARGGSGTASAAHTEDAVVTSTAAAFPSGGRLRARYAADDENPFSSPTKAADLLGKTSPAPAAKSSTPVPATNKDSSEEESSSAFSTLSEVAAKAVPPLNIQPASISAPLSRTATPLQVTPTTATPVPTQEAGGSTAAGGQLTFTFKPYDPFSSAQPAAGAPSLLGGGLRSTTTPVSFSSLPAVVPSLASNVVSANAAQPLASQPVASAPNKTPAVDAKVLELRETTDAVERLVRAFVTLRGHDAAANVAPDIDYHRTMIGFGFEQTALPNHRQFGNAANERTSAPSFTNAQRERRMLLEAESRLAGRGLDQAIAAEAIQERLLEEEMCDVVLSLMVTNAASHARFHPSREQQQQQGPSSSSRKTNPLKPLTGKTTLRHPLAQIIPQETVTVSAWRGYTQERAASTSYGRGATAARAGGLHEAFSMDPTSLAALSTAPRHELEQLIVSSLDKYVVNRVASKKIPNALGKVVLIDLADVMTEIILERFHGGDCSNKVFASGGPVFVQYDGPSQLEPAVKEFALSAIHALPFEDIDGPPLDEASSSSSTMRHTRRRFRLDHWVSRENALVTLHALHATLRRLEQLSSDGYESFSNLGNEKRSGGGGGGGGGSQGQVKRRDVSGRRGGATADIAGCEAPGVSFFVTELPLFSLLPSMYGTSTAARTQEQDSADEDSKPPAASCSRGGEALPSTSTGIILGRFSQEEDSIASILLPLSTIALDVQQAISTTTAAGQERRDSARVHQEPLPPSLLQSIINEATLETVAELVSDISISQAVTRKATERARKAIDEQVTFLQSRQLRRTGPGGSSSADLAKLESENRTRRIQQVQEAEVKVNKLVNLIRQEIESEVHSSTANI